MSEKKKAGASKQKRQPPSRFKSVEEESDFWDSHSFLDYGDWEAVSYEEVCEELGARSEPKVLVTLRLEKRLLKRLKEAAQQHGIKYQALAREILWRSLSGKAR